MSTETIVKLPFTAALIAGGQSRRMGTNKAELRLSWEGRRLLLWKKQLLVLAQAGPEKLLISGPPRSVYPASVAVIPDRYPGSGPLGGIATVLEEATTELVLVLPVDAPWVDLEFVSDLLARCSDRCGVVPRLEQRYEPLIAVYPRQACPVAVRLIRRGELRLQHFVETLAETGLVSSWTVPAELAVRLTNWNWPEDVKNGVVE
jgi:molybdopterin-guanine dinucleotide biosynthesis protein A